MGGKTGDVVSGDPVKVERILKAFANRRRITIIRLLKRRGETTVGDIADAIKLSFKATSKHLAILTAAEITVREQRSMHVQYRLSPDVLPLSKILISTLS